MIQVEKLVVVLLLSAQSFATTGVCLAQPLQARRIDLVSTWGICGKDIVLAKGTIEVDTLGSATGKLIFQGSKASFVTKLRTRDRIAVHFLREDSEHFEMEGVLSKGKAEGTWRSVTLSCGGEWHADGPAE